MFRFICFLAFLLSISQPLVLITTSASLSDHRDAAVTSPCPLNFELLRDSKRPNPNTNSQCQYIRQGLRLVLSDHLRRTNSFLPPIDSAESCWSVYESLVKEYAPGFDIHRRCGFETPWIARGCMNIATRSEFEAAVPRSALGSVAAACNQSLFSNSPCASCTTALAGIQASYLLGTSVGNVSDCTAFPFIYAAAFANQFGPTDAGTAKCLFNLDFTPFNSSSKKKKIIISVVAVGCIVILILGFAVSLFLRRRRGKLLKENWLSKRENETSVSPRLGSINASTSLIRFTFDEIKTATRRFSSDNIIGRGGYGNVFKGMLPDGSEVAFKRFKNCSAAGDASFRHEVEVIASVRHVNLVALRGYCTATTPLEGHQRIIVCDLMKNGSVHDHLFGLTEKKLSWPTRQRIALGTARGLAYMHHGAQPRIIHRDIKASNILLDERFEPKVADFGFAKFTPEGMTHMSTRVAGTVGYVAPEYALFGHLSERSDVYSFGVVLLELLSGKKAVVADGETTTLVSDWAWSLVRKGRALDVVEEGMPEMGPPEVLERFVVVALLCSHPQLCVRPKMEQVVKMLDADVPIPSIPERPLSLIANIDDIERSVTVSSGGGSGRLSTPAGYQAFTFDPEGGEEDGDESSGVS